MPAPSRPSGPDFLPYPLPSAAPDPVASPQPLPAAAGRPPGTPWLTAERGLAAAAVLAVLLLSIALGWRAVGAVTATAAAGTGVAVALRRRVVRTSELVGSAAAVAAVLLLVLARSAPAPVDAAVPPVVPSPPTPTAPPFDLPPMATAVPGVPTEPDPPLSAATTATGALVGRVLDRSGQPVAGAVVAVVRAQAGDVSDAPRCPVRVRTTTDATGAYRLMLCQLADGLGYAVRIGVGGATAQATLFVNAGRTTVYNVILDLRHA